MFTRLNSTKGRDGIEASEGAVMLRPLICGSRAQDSPVFLRGLACAVALTRREVPDPSLSLTGVGMNHSSFPSPSGSLLPKAGGVGRSGPPKPHPLDLEGKLYNDLVEVLDIPPPAPLKAVRGMVRMGFLESVMRFLVRDDDEGCSADDGSASLPETGVEVGGGGVRSMRRRKKAPRRARGPYYFSLKQRHACLGAVALHGLSVLAGPQPCIFTEPTLRYLCYSIQVAYIDLTVGRLAPGVEYPLVIRSIQLTCRALAFLATSEGGEAPSAVGKRGHEIADDDHKEESGVWVNRGPLRRVADSLISTTAINELACLAQMPSKTAWSGDGGFMYRHLEQTVSSAAILIASVCPVPAGERDPFSRQDPPEKEGHSNSSCPYNTKGGNIYIHELELAFHYIFAVLT